MKFKIVFSKIAKNITTLAPWQYESCRKQDYVLRKKEEFRALTGSYDFFIEAHKRSIEIAQSIGYESHKMTMMGLEFVSYCLKIGADQSKILFYLRVYKNNFKSIQTAVDIIKYTEETTLNDHELLIKAIEYLIQKNDLKKEIEKPKERV